jgi:putative membrane protein
MINETFRFSRVDTVAAVNKSGLRPNAGSGVASSNLPHVRHNEIVKPRRAKLQSASDLTATTDTNLAGQFAGAAVQAPLGENSLENHAESKSFLATALAWQGSVTPRVLPRVAITALYAASVYGASLLVPAFALPMTPFEYSGAVLALILVLRVNAGQDRWWEARKIWGSIVNQSRNLALVVYGYSDRNDENVAAALRWIAAWPHVMRESLRREAKLSQVSALVGELEVDKLRKAENMSMYVAMRIADSLMHLRRSGLDSFAFLRAETERSQLIDAIGACERIRNTRMPLVLAIKTRRFILLFLLLLPFALLDRAGVLMPLIVALTSYPLFSLDEIGAELQNPFSARNLSHLPLDGICGNISANVMGLLRN